MCFFLTVGNNPSQNHCFLTNSKRTLLKDCGTVVRNSTKQNKETVKELNDTQWFPLLEVTFGKRYSALVRVGQLLHDLPMKLPEGVFCRENGMGILRTWRSSVWCCMMMHWTFETQSALWPFFLPRGYGETPKRPFTSVLMGMSLAHIFFDLS